LVKVAVVAVVVVVGEVAEVVGVVMVAVEVTRAMAVTNRVSVMFATTSLRESATAPFASSNTRPFLSPRRVAVWIF
jgi:hypothetical protein